MKVEKKIISIFILVILCAALIQIQRLGYMDSDANRYFNNISSVIMNEDPVSSMSMVELEESESKKILMIYDSEDTSLVSYKDRMLKNLNYMKINSESVDIQDALKKDYRDYESVILMVSNVELNLGKDLYRLLDYVENGGKLLWGITPSETSEDFEEIYKRVGIDSIRTFKEIEGLKFVEDVIPGSSGRQFIDSNAFTDSCLDVKLDRESRIYIESAGKNSGIPIMWQRNLGLGNIVFYNGGGLGGHYYGGVLAGALSILNDDFMYPIINSKVVYIDDFPSPQYDSESDVISNTYNKTVKEFYRDIWWPDMQRVARQYNIAYTGLFISTYNDIVDPEKFEFEDDKMMQYYGNSLLKNNFEIGLHGYNHQSLVSEGYLPDEVGYKPWKSQEDMEKSLRSLKDYSEELFPGCIFYSYVPPSNYLSQQGRDALRNALPDLKVISGLYYDSAQEGEGRAYVQDFETAEDGITEFPRITSGMWRDDSTIFEYLNGIGLHGVFSHFIHPDDILNDERGRGSTWDNLLENYAGILKDIYNTYPDLRALKSRDTSRSVKIFEDLKIKIEYEEDRILGKCNDFYGQAFFYLRTEKTPKAMDDSCTISRIAKGDYYMITVNDPVFSIKLEKNN